MPAGSITARLNLNAAGWSSAVDKAIRETNKLQAATREMGHKSVSEMQAISASIRVVEGNMVNNVRAAERFLSIIPGIGGALKAAFPVVGAIAFLGVAGEMIKRVYEFVHTLEQARNVAREGLFPITEQAQKTVDSMRVTNDKLEEQIALLEHKPVNTVATALDEARVRADELAISLNKDYMEFKKLLDVEQGGVLQRIADRVLGKGLTQDVHDPLQDKLANIATLGLQAQDKTLAGDTTGAADLNQKLRSAQEALRQWSATQIAMRQGRQQYQSDGSIAYAPSFSGPSTTYAGAHGDQGANIDALQGAQRAVMTQMAIADQDKRNIADQAKAKQDEAANKAEEAARKAQELLLKTMEEGLAKRTAMYGRDIAGELAYWSARINAFAEGSEQYHTVQMDQYKLQAELYEKLMEGKKKYLEASKGDVEGNNLMAQGAEAFHNIDLEQMERASKSAEKYNEITEQSAQIAMKSRAAFEESAIAIGLQEGKISKLAAAQELAKVHAQEHADALAAVNRELATQIGLINSDPRLTAEDRSNAIRDAKDESGNKTADIDGAYAVTQQRDAANVYQNTSSGMASDTVRNMLQNWAAMTQNIAQAMVRAADSLNDNLAKLITGQGKKGDFGHTFSQLGESMVKASLQKGESMLFGNIFKGKGTPGSSPMNRSYVSAIIEGGMGTPAGGGSAASAAGLLGKIPGIGPFIRPFQGFFAGGGDVLANHPAMVGESGPEMFVPRTAGRIVPNHELSGGGNTYHQYTVNVTGNQDPMAVHAAVARALPHAVAASLQAQHQSAKRSPGSR